MTSAQRRGWLATIAIAMLALALVAKRACLHWRTSAVSTSPIQPMETPFASAKLPAPPAAGALGRPELRWLLPNSSRHRKVAGTVYLDTQPVRASVALTSHATSSGLAAEPTVASNPDGTFDFGEVVIDSYMLTARVGNLSRSIELDLDAFVDPAHLVVHVYPCDLLIGHVIDAGGGLIGNAIVRNAFTGVLLATSSQTGEFTACKDDGALRVSADGYTSELTGLFVVSPAMIVMRPETTVTGHVVDSHGAPVDGAEISERDAIAFSDSNGRFELRGLSPGHHELKAHRDDLISCKKTPVDTTVGAVTDVTIALDQGVAISGYVHRGTAAAPGVEIVWSMVKTPLLRMHSDSDGKFSSTGACAGDGRVFSILENLVAPANGAFSLAAGHNHVDVELAPAVKREVRVVAGSVPVSDATVIATCEPAAPEAWTPRTDGNGHTVVLLSPNAQCTIIAQHAFDSRRAQSSPFTSGENDGELTLDLGPRSESSITAIVTDKSGAPASGIRVVLETDDDSVAGVATSDASGTAVLRFVASGSYHFATLRTSLTLTVLASVAAPSHIVITNATSNEQVTIVVELPQSSITGVVVDEHGAPVADAKVAVYALPDQAIARDVTNVVNDTMQVLGAATTATDIDGRFAVKTSEAAPYTISAYSSVGHGVLQVSGSATTDLRVVVSQRR